MDLSDYFIHNTMGGFMQLIYRPTQESLINTQYISMDTMMRLCIVHNAKLKGISL